MSAKAKTVAKRGKTAAPEPATKAKVCTFVFSDGSIYEGEVKDDAGSPIVRHGRGKMTFAPQNCVYTGDWAHDKMHGRGRIEFANGSSYDGEWVDNSYEGSGRFQWADGLLYDGQWSANLMQGSGTLRDPQSVQWTGQFQAGVGERLLVAVDQAMA